MLYNIRVHQFIKLLYFRFSLAFFAFLRVGEFAESHLSEKHMLQYSDISIDKENGLINLSLPSS